MKQILIAAALSLMATQSFAGAIVVGKDSPIAAIDAEEAKKIFLGHEPQMGGQTLAVLYQKDSATRTDFETKVLGKTGADLSGYWAKLVFTGKAQAPEEVSGDAGVKAKVAGSPSAIGYVSDAGIDASVKLVLKY